MEFFGELINLIAGKNPVSRETIGLDIDEELQPIVTDRLNVFNAALYDIDQQYSVLPPEEVAPVPEPPKEVPISAELLDYITGMDGAAVEASVKEALTEEAPMTVTFTDEEERAQSIAQARAALEAAIPVAEATIPTDAKELIDA